MNNDLSEASTSSIFGFQLSTRLRNDLNTLLIWSRIVGIIAILLSTVSIIESLMKQEEFLANFFTFVINIIIYGMLLLFSLKAQKALRSEDSSTLTESFKFLKNYFWAQGIIIILLLVFILVVFIYFMVAVAI